MTVADRASEPVVCAAGQVTSRDGVLDPARAPDPLALMASAVDRATAEAGGRRLERAVTHLWVVPPLSLRHHDPARLLADRLGLSSVEVRCGGMGGNVPQWLVNRAAELVRSGSRPCVVVVGAEALATRRAARQQGVDLSWPGDGGFPSLWPPLEADMGVHPVERAHGLSAATAAYALIESALAHRRQLDPATHRHAMGELMAPCSAVAAQNPYAWFPTARQPDELVTVTPENRMVCHPYPKYLNAVLDVDMAAAVVVTDAARAADLGLGPAEVAHLVGFADATEVWHVAARPDPSRTPGLEQAAQEALAMAELGATEIDLFDLYACFPSALAAAAEAIGAPAGAPLTATGALPYHGGPGSNYGTHAIANVLTALRTHTADTALVHGNGYYLTKHAVGVYQRRPRRPAAARAAHVGSDPAGALRLPAAGPVEARLVVDHPETTETGVVVGATVPFDRAGQAQTGIVLLELPDGRRTVAHADRELTDAIVESRAVGATVSVRALEAADAPESPRNLAALA